MPGKSSNTVSRLSDAKELPNEFCQKFKDFFEGIKSAVPDHKTMHTMVTNPKEFGLRRDSLCVKIINGYLNNTNERTIIDELKAIGSEGEYANQGCIEADSRYKNMVLHWCALFNNALLLQFLLVHWGYSSQLEEKNASGLKPMQVACLHRQNDFVLKQFKATPRYSTLRIFEHDLNEYHLAILLGNIKLLSGLLEIHAEKNIAIALKKGPHKNIFHFVVYSALLEKGSTNGYPSTAYEIGRVIKNYMAQQHEGVKKIEEYLSESTEDEPLSPRQMVEHYKLPSDFFSDHKRSYLLTLYARHHSCGLFSTIMKAPKELDGLVVDYLAEDDLKKIISI